MMVPIKKNINSNSSLGSLFLQLHLSASNGKVWSLSVKSIEN